MNLFLTTANIDQAFSEAMGQALGGLMALIVILWIFGILVLVAVVALITWVVKKVWHAGENREHKRQQKEWARAQRKWSRKDAKAQRQLYREYTPPQKAPPKKSPDEIFAESPDWEWDERYQIWRHKKSE